MNFKMQQFFRDWYTADPTVSASASFVNQNEIEIMTRLNAELREKIDDAALQARFRNNVDLIRDLMHEITDRVKRIQPQVTIDFPIQSATTNRLDSVFDALNI